MNATRLLAAGLIAAGWPAIYRRLQHRHRWEQHNREVYLALYFEQIVVAAVRSGVPLYDLLHECRHHGATHIALLEDTLDGLLKQGDLVQTAADTPVQHRFTSGRPGLIARLQAEFAVRAPQCLAEKAVERTDELVLLGDLAALRVIGLGFDPETFALARSAGLRLIARPVSYPWPTPETIERTLAQAAALGAGTIAFAHDPLLGHEMNLAATAASLRRHSLFAAYYPDSRHQRGDWFIAKTAPERALLALRYTPTELDREDEASLAYRAALRAREGGIRLIFVDAFIGIHATTPTAVLRYLDELVHALTGHDSFQIDIPDRQHTHESDGHDHEPGHGAASSAALPDLLPLSHVQTAVTQVLQAPLVDSSPEAGSSHELLIPAFGLALLALDRVTPMPPLATLALISGGYALAANVLARLDQPRDALERTYTPSYSAKLLALAALATGPAAGPLGLLAAPAAGMLAAAATNNPDYFLRIESLRTYQLDWAIPFAVQLAAAPPAFLEGRKRWLGAAAVLGLPLLLRQRLSPDAVDALDREHPAGHTHHLSAAQRATGDARMALSPQPLRKWTGLTLLWLPYLLLPRGSNTRAVAGLIATAGAISTAGTLRQTSRPIALSIAQTARSWALSAPLAAGAALAKAALRR